MCMPHNSSGCLELDAHSLALAKSLDALVKLYAHAKSLAGSSQQVVQVDVQPKLPAILKLTQNLSELRQDTEQHVARLLARMRHVLAPSAKLDRCHVSTARVSQGAARARRPATRKAPAAKSSDSDGGPSSSDEDAPEPHSCFTLLQHPGFQPPDYPLPTVTSSHIVTANKHRRVHLVEPVGHVLIAAIALAQNWQHHPRQWEVQRD